MSEINQGGETVTVSVEENVVVGGSGAGSHNMFDRWAEKIVWFLVFLVPVLSLPMRSLPMEAGKKYIFFIGLIAALVMWVMGRFTQRRGRFVLDPVLASLSLIPLIAGASALASDAPRVGLVGSGFDVGTVCFLLAGTLAAWLASAYATRSSFIKSYYRTIGLLAIVGVVFQVIHIMLPSVTSFAPFLESTTTLLGKWNDFGIFLGLATILSLIALLDHSVRPAFARAVFGLSLFGLVMVNFYPVWMLVGLAGAAVLVYEAIVGAHGQRRISWSALGLTLVSLIFIFSGAPDQFVGRQVARLGFPSVVEVRPSWPATFSISADSLRSDPILGVGPNRFVKQWLLSKPAEVNQTIFWGVDFNTSVGYIPTFLVTTGLLGILAWFVFVASLFVSGIRTFMKGDLEQALVVPALMVWLSAMYLWFFAFIYTPDTSLLVLAFTLTGVYAAVHARHSTRRFYGYSLARNEVLGLMGTAVLLVVGLILPLVSAFSVTKKAYAITLFEKGTTQLRAGDLAGGIDLIKRSTSTHERDDFYRILAEANIARITQLITSGTGTSDELRNQFGNLSNEAINSARRAVEIDNTRYTNWLTLGNVYRTLASVKVSGAYEISSASYLQAAELYPTSPSLYLEMARLEAQQGNRTAARDKVKKAIEQKTNYTDAILFLSQIEGDAGNTREAIKKAEEAVALSPRDVGTHFQLGLLYYKNANYKAAAESLERAVFLVPAYSNARYFLGLAYSRLGRIEEAVFQFTEIDRLNPGNAEVKQILENLKAGRPALSQVSGGAPEQREKPPIEESTPQAQ